MHQTEFVTLPREPRRRSVSLVPVAMMHEAENMDSMYFGSINARRGKCRLCPVAARAVALREQAIVCCCLHNCGRTMRYKARVVMV
jgi:hypothetical protein